MEQQRWRQIEEIFHSAKQRDPGRRRAFLREACSGDEDLLPACKQGGTDDAS